MTQSNEGPPLCYDSYEITYSDRDRDRDFFGDSDRRLFDLDRLRDFERLFDRLLERRALRQQV